MHFGLNKMICLGENKALQKYTETGAKISNVQVKEIKEISNCLIFCGMFGVVSNRYRRRG
jgi:hypothetical protein